ncbi:MAG: PIG-L family deacetylase [Acidimicrobiales bacterium]
MIRQLADEGTPESSWVAWLGGHELPPLIVPPATHVVVVAPHPDDEILGCGGLLRRLHQDGIPITIVAVTDGEASHPDSVATTPAELTVLRTAEAVIALDRLGLGGTSRVRLRIPDGRVSDHRRALTEALVAVSVPGAVILAPWEGDGHPDHDATGWAALDAAERSSTPLLRYLVWTWHWAVPGDPSVPWGLAVRIGLGPDDLRAKRWAVDAFESQLRPVGSAPADAPILTAAELAHHLRGEEVYLR